MLVDIDKKRVKICDFGSSSIDCTCCNGPKRPTGTTPWDSPELWMDEEEGPRTPKSDMWAFGCVALEVRKYIRCYL